MIDEPQLRRELDAAQDRLNQAGRDRLWRAGVGIEAECRAGGLGIERIMADGHTYMPVPHGQPALIVPVYAGPPPSLYVGELDTPLRDLVALRTHEPDVWWRRIGEPFAVLGIEQLERACDDADSLRLHPHPLSWLQSACEGVCLLDWLEACAMAGAEEAREAA